MSVCCGVECVLLLGCSRWAWKRCTHVGSDDSETWPSATHDEFEPVPRLCRLILAVYETDLRNPQCPPDGGYRLNPDWVLKHADYEQTLGRSPPYLIYADHDRKEIVMAIRGLNLVKDCDYKLLLDNRLGMQMFDGGYVHHGLLKSAVWLLNEESETLKRVWEETGREYQLILAGHSLGSGVASLMTVLLVNHRDRLGGIPRNKIRCYALAPARCMSLNLAVKYADVIHSIVLQIMRENKSETITVPPRIQKLERMQTIEKEHKDALQKAVSLNIPHAGEPIEIEETETETESAKADDADSPKAKPEVSSRGTNWDELVEKLFKRSESGKLILNTESNTLQIQ